MTNPPCTPISMEEEDFLMKAFPCCLSDSDEAVGRKFFQQLVFFRTEEKGIRRCVCTSCLEGFYAYRELHPAFFQATHGKRCECPNCGQAATLAAMGKFQNFSSLSSSERAVQVTVRGSWLLVQTGRLRRTFDPDDLGGYLDFEPFCRYAFAPGKRVMWSRRTVSWFGSYHTDGPWIRENKIRVPFISAPYEREASYILLGAEYLSIGPMRYNGYAAWFDREYGGDINDLDWIDEPFRVAYLIRYLAEYTRFPQMEILTKLGYPEVVSDLVIRKNAHKDILDWSAKNPADFFRLNRHDFKLFSQGVGTFSGLKLFRKMQKTGLVRDLRHYAAEQAECGTYFETVCQSCLLAGVSLERGKHYLQHCDGQDGLTLRTAPQFWLDYLTAAKTLKYDLSRDDVRMPKDLRLRHDEATAAEKIVLDKKAQKRMAARYTALVSQFEYEADGLCVRVPASIQEIINEGKTLRHCVGGYAERHMKGIVTILFLRKLKNPEAPYVTMELTTDNNCRNLRIVQIHGFENDRKAMVKPLERHAGFLTQWLEWVHQGSPRLPDRTPDVPVDAEPTSA